MFAAQEQLALLNSKSNFWETDKEESCQQLVLTTSPQEFTDSELFLDAAINPPSHTNKKKRNHKLITKQVKDFYNNTILIQEEKRIRYPQHIVVPKPLKRDVRRLYAEMFVNVINSNDINEVEGYFNHFAMSNLVYMHRNLSKKDMFLRLDGKAVMLQLWFNRIHCNPDSTISVGNIKVHTYSHTEESKITCEYIMHKTQIHDIDRHHMLPSAAMISKLTINNHDNPYLQPMNHDHNHRNVENLSEHTEGAVSENRRFINELNAANVGGSSTVSNSNNTNNNHNANHAHGGHNHSHNHHHSHGHSDHNSTSDSCNSNSNIINNSNNNNMSIHSSHDHMHSHVHSASAQSNHSTGYSHTEHNHPLCQFNNTAPQPQSSTLHSTTKTTTSTTPGSQIGYDTSIIDIVSRAALLPVPQSVKITGVLTMYLNNQKEITALTFDRTDSGMFGASDKGKWGCALHDNNQSL